MSPDELAIAKEHYEKWSSNVLLRKLITEDEHFLWDFVPAALDEIEQQGKRIENLIKFHAEETDRFCSAQKQIAKQRAALKKLGKRSAARGKALVEERARRICHIPREDSVGHWPRYTAVVVDEAREQLRREGKL